DPVLPPPVPAALEQRRLLRARVAPGSPEVEHDDLAAQRRERQRARRTEPGQREAGHALGTLQGLRAAVRQLPDEQREQPEDDPDGERMCAQAKRATHADTMNTGVPTRTRSNRNAASAGCSWMQPCESEYPIEAATGASWIPTP